METQKQTALIVDDDISKANLIKFWLEKYGINSNIICSYHEVVSKLHDKYDYLIIDFFLDGKCTGDNFAKVYQKNNPNCKTVIYSGKPDMTGVYGVVDFGNLDQYIREMIGLKISNKCIIEKTSNKNIKETPYKNNRQIELIGSDMKEIKDLIYKINLNIIEYNKTAEELKILLNKLIEKKNNNIKKMILKIIGLIK
jgi:DNA-binding NtrC family response regulator